ncbi:hypothetical protein [Actinomycetospora sp. NBRC 106378]|uniref:hypothetical protein n=1 Tax=Actinomycetospora sp. NBRC 106378 TaxID=3032208 RepID=UPI002555D8F4|nr:hypothetical protein [Actinomycetospora sp. NBRC 106378]
MGEWLSTPESWIRAAAVLIGIAVVLLIVAAVVGWRARRRARRDALPDGATEHADRGSRRLLAALVADPDAAVAALGRDGEPCATAIELLRAGVPAGGVARLTGIDVSELGDVVAARLGVLEPS